MQRYFPLFVLLSTVAGALCVILTIIWLLSRTRLNSFRKVALAFVFAGAIIPIVILPIWFWTNEHPFFSRFEDVAVVLWPSSIVTMALEGPEPAPWSTIAFVYGFAILGNVGLYGTVGLIVAWVYVRFRRNIAGG